MLSCNIKNKKVREWYWRSNFFDQGSGVSSFYIYIICVIAWALDLREIG